MIQRRISIPIPRHTGTSHPIRPPIRPPIRHTTYISRPLPRQRQILIPLGPRQRTEVLPRDVLERRPADGLADEGADELGVGDDAEAEGVVQEGGEVVLGYAAADAFCARGVLVSGGVGGRGWEKGLTGRVEESGWGVLFMTASRPLRSLMVYLAREEAGYSVVRPMGWPRVVMV